MIKIFISNLLIILSVLNSQDAYLLQDENPNSLTYGTNVGPLYFEGKVVLHYFGAFT